MVSFLLNHVHLWVQHKVREIGNECPLIKHKYFDLGRLLRGVSILNSKIAPAQEKYLQVSWLIFQRKARRHLLQWQAIPRGGVIVGDAIANKFSRANLISLFRKLGAPNNPELAIGAVIQDRTAYLNERLIHTLQVSTDYIDGEIEQQVQVQRISLPARQTLQHRR